MDRHAGAASQLLALSLALVAGHHCAWALHTTGIDVIEQDVAGDNGWSGINIWYLPEAIAKVTGKPPGAEWREYLTMDFLGDLLSVERIDRGKMQWWPPTTCPFGDAIQVSHYDQEKCIGVGEGICKDGWQFGIRHGPDTTYLILHNADGDNEVYRWFPGATQLCIGEKYPNVAYLRVDHDGGQYFLIGPGDESDYMHAKLEIVTQGDAIVEFQGGTGTALWQLFANGISSMSNDALWYPIPLESLGHSSSVLVTEMPTSGPTAEPAYNPSKSPTIAPSVPLSSPSLLLVNPPMSSREPSAWLSMHTAIPMAHPSPLPSPKPSVRAASTDLPAISEVPIAMPSFEPTTCAISGDKCESGKDGAPIIPCCSIENTCAILPGLGGRCITTSEPTLSPTLRPTVTATSPSASPESSTSVSPSSTLTMSPTARPSRLVSPSAKPSLRASSSSPTAKDELAGYEIALTTVKEDWIWTRDYSKCER